MKYMRASFRVLIFIAIHLARDVLVLQEEYCQWVQPIAAAIQLMPTVPYSDI